MVINGKVSLPRFVVVDTMEALDWAVIHDPTVLFLVSALIGVLLCSVIGEATDVAVDVFGQVFALLRHVGEDVATGTLSKGDEFAHKAYS